jgi:hypothetical protein
MRRIVFILSIVCAILSGWTSALGQAQQLGGSNPNHGLHATGQSGHAAHGTMVQHAACDTDAEQCGKRAGHPMVCAACYAIPAENLLSPHPAIKNRGVPPALQASLDETPLEPQFPPPRTSFLL